MINKTKEQTQREYYDSKEIKMTLSKLELHEIMYSLIVSKDSYFKENNQDMSDNLQTTIDKIIQILNTYDETK